MNVYQGIYEAYRKADEQTRRTTRSRYEARHATNSDRKDLHTITGKVLAALDKADRGMPF